MSQLTIPGVIACDFSGCKQPVCEKELGYKPAFKRFCQDHSDEIDALFDAGNAKEIINFRLRSATGKIKS